LCPRLLTAIAYHRSYYSSYFFTHESISKVCLPEDLLCAAEGHCPYRQGSHTLLCITEHQLALRDLSKHSLSKAFSLELSRFRLPCLCLNRYSSINYCTWRWGCCCGTYHILQLLFLSLFDPPQVRYLHNLCPRLLTALLLHQVSKHLHFLYGALYAFKSPTTLRGSQNSIRCSIENMYTCLWARTSGESYNLLYYKFCLKHWTLCYGPMNMTVTSL